MGKILLKGLNLAGSLRLIVSNVNIIAVFLAKYLTCVNSPARDFALLNDFFVALAWPIIRYVAMPVNSSIDSDVQVLKC